MAIEIERKFLVKGDFTKGVFESERIVQGYICSTPGRTVRVRIRGKAGFLTINGPSYEKGLSRYEFEQQISLSDANQLMKLCESGVIDKVRNLVHCGKRVWKIDVFHGANEVLIIAEIELGSENESFEKPDWLGEEVSGDRRYYNSMLIAHPYSEWKNS